MNCMTKLVQSPIVWKNNETKKVFIWKNDLSFDLPLVITRKSKTFPDERTLLVCSNRETAPMEKNTNWRMQNSFLHCPTTLLQYLKTTERQESWFQSKVWFERMKIFFSKQLNGLAFWIDKMSVMSENWKKNSEKTSALVWNI